MSSVTCLRLPFAKILSCTNGSTLNRGLNAKTPTMVLPRRQILPASVFCSSTTGTFPRCRILPRMVRENVTSGFHHYLRPPLMIAPTKPPNIIWVVAVITMAATTPQPSHHHSNLYIRVVSHREAECHPAGKVEILALIRQLQLQPNLRRYPYCTKKGSDRC